MAGRSEGPSGVDYRGSVRSLAEDIRSRTDEELVRLLLARPDLARPRPTDLTALAARAATQASTTRAVDHLDLRHLVVLQSCVALDGDAGPAAGPPDDGVAVPGVSALTGLDPELVATLIGDLHDQALLWRSATGLVPARTASEVLTPDVASLGPSLQAHQRALEPATAALLGQLDELSTEELTVLRRLAWQGPSARTPDPATRAGRAVADLVARGLLLDTSGTVTLPREVALRIRAGLADPPAPEPSKGAEHADRVAAGAVSELVADVDELLRQVDRLRPRVLRSGGLAVRDLRELSSRTGLDQERTLLLLELAGEAGLLADDHATEPAWRLTTLADEWHEREDAARWHDLALPWLVSLRAPLVPGGEESRGNALSDGLSWPPVRALRLEVLRLAVELPAGRADAAQVTDALRRSRPRRLPREADEVVRALLVEHTALGLLALDAVTTAGRLLAADPQDPGGRAREAVAELLPAPVTEALLQADLTAVVPGVPAPALADLLRRSATLESRGGAAVFRFTEDSIRGALDGGWVAEDLLEAIGRASATGVPQPLQYLVRDVARRHGTLRVGAVASYLRSDDPAHLESLARHRELGHLQLRQIAPTVLVSPASAAVLLESVREVGASPVLESGGGVVSSGPSRRRVPPPRRRGVTDVEPDAPGEVVTALRAAEDRPRRETGTGRSVPALDPVSSAALLREAAADRLPVWVGVTDAVGSTSRLLFHPRQVEGGRVHGEVDGSPRTLSLHRITGVGDVSPESLDDPRG
ncbi:helicase-associated domain-containing protein [Janibacter alkaliphilus]